MPSLVGSEMCIRDRFFAWVGLALGWGVRRFHNNMHIVSNPTEFRKSQTPYSCRCVLKPKADYYADPIPSFRFWSGRENKALSCKIETGFLCGDGARVIRSFARVIQRLGFGTHRKLQPTSATGTSGAAPSALRSALGSSIHAYAQTLVWPRRDVPRRFTWCFFSTKHPIPARELLLCVYSRMIRKPRKTRTGCARCSPCYLGPIPPRPTASCSLAAVRRGDFVRASWLYS